MCVYSNMIIPGIYVEDNMFSPCPRQNNALDQCIYIDSVLPILRNRSNIDYS